MRTIDGATRAAWLSGDYTGDRRPMVRATIASLAAITVPYKTQVFCATVWGQQAQPVELPNIKSLKWSRSLDSDAATMTLELYNTEPLPLGQPPSKDGELDIPGYYTYNRGKTQWSTSRFGQQPTGWHDRIVPDRIIRTYEGYGFDRTVVPEADPHMYLSGVWLVDTVEYTHDGMITVTCRDLTRILLDQISYVPVVPFKQYPLHFTAYYSVANPPTHTVSGTTKWVHPSFSDSSNTPYIPTKTSPVYGHRGTDAFDTSLSTYWLSIGNAVPSADYSYEWIEGKIKSNTLSAIKFKVWGGPYRVYVSVFANGAWQGDQTVPYNADDPVAAPNGANIRYVTAFSVGDGVVKSHKFSTAFTGVTKIRLTFTHLYNSGLGPYHYRAGCRDFQVAVGGTSVTETSSGTHTEGNYGDFTDIIKLFLAYGGFYWPSDVKRAVRRQSDGTYVTNVGPNDAYLQRGSIWGVLQQTGTAGIVPLQADVFDKKSLMDCINYIRDIVGFVFFVDEYGSAVWRLGNVWQVGNYIRDDGGTLGHTITVEELDERTVLLGLRAKLDSRNVREKIFVANVAGRVGAVTNGFNPYPSGLRRVGGWCVDTDTEIFTRRGWLRYDQVREGDETLSLDHEGNAVWQAIREVAKFDAAPRTMVHIKANNFDALTTPDHRWLTETYDTQRREWLQQYRTTDRLSRLSRVARAARGGAATAPMISDALVEIVAWTYTEGSVQAKKNWRGVCIYQSPTANPDKCEAIRLALKAAFGDTGWRSRIRKGCEEFTLNAQSSREVCRYLDGDKAPTADFLTALTQDQLELFIDVSVAADGWIRNGRHRSFAQSVGPRLDAFLFACALAGVPTSWHERDGEGNWFGRGRVADVSLYSTERHAAIGQMAREEQAYDGVVWCPAMPTHHNWLARRNGSVYYTGNTDQNFKNASECQIMADMIVVQQMYSYRTDTVTIAGYPGIQIDDQVRIYERITNEGYLHYVRGVDCSWDLETGKYTYTLTTNWLGVTPFTNWVIDPAKMAAETKQYLNALGVPV